MSELMLSCPVGACHGERGRTTLFKACHGGRGRTTFFKACHGERRRTTLFHACHGERRRTTLFHACHGERGRRPEPNHPDSACSGMIAYRLSTQPTSQRHSQNESLSLTLTKTCQVPQTPLFPLSL